MVVWVTTPIDKIIHGHEIYAFLDLIIVDKNVSVRRKDRDLIKIFFDSQYGRPYEAKCSSRLF
jgi:hypothetical protein